MSSVSPETHIPKWHQELVIFSQIKNSIILEGNIHDTYPYPTGDFEGAWLNLPQYLHVFFSELGYQNIIQYNHIDGFSCEAMDPSERDSQLQVFHSIARADIQDGRIPARFSAEPNGAPFMIRDAITQTHTPIVIILNYTSRYIAAPDRMMPPDQMCFSILQQAVIEAGEAPVSAQSSARLKNMLVLITDKKNDIPAWMYLGVSQIKGIIIDHPSAADRLHFIGGYAPSDFFDKNVYLEDMADYIGRENELHKVIDKFVSRTEGFTYFELEQLQNLCCSRGIHIPKMCSVVDLYTYGILENPWEDQGLISRLRSGKEILTRRVKGQEEAITQSLDILKRAVSGLSKVRNSASPKGVLFFAGPTGTGKTETAKTLAELVFGDESACIRFDMSEYSQDNSDQRLLGAPPGYVGYEAGGQLTNAVRKNPFSILLFDEIEKANPLIMDKFLQILEDGRMTDGQGNTVYFSDCIIIFTSNLGIYSTDRYGNRQVNVSRDMPKDTVRAKVIDAIQDHFKLKLGRPEILNRIGENIVVFNYITKDVAAEIVKSRLKSMHSSILDEIGVNIDFSQIENQLLDLAVENLDNGGRGINNVIEKSLINPLGRHIFDDNVAKGEHLVVTRICDDLTPVDIEWRRS